MYRPNTPRFNGPPVANRGQLYAPIPRQRAPNNYRNVAPNVQSKDSSKSSQSQASKLPPPALKPFGPEINRWKSSFAEIEENDKDKNTGNDESSFPERKRFHLYDPYEDVKSDLEDNKSPKPPDGSSKPHTRWDIDASTKQRLSSKPPQFPIQQSDSAERAGCSSGGGTADHKDVDYRPEVTTVKDLGATTVRLSPPPSLHKFKQSPGYSGAAQVLHPRPEVKADSSRNEFAPPKNLVSCDLCEVELSNGQELEEHLDSKIHWDTLEYIKKHNKYDDMAIAFLQDVMIYKSRKSNRAIEDTALQALQEYDHMTKVEMFHCAACNTFVPTSAFAVQNHITTQGHMTNTKEFEARQRRLCLNKANTMMKELMPQFMTFSQGESPFQCLEKPTS